MTNYLFRLTVLCGILFSTVLHTKGQNLKIYTQQGEQSSIPISTIRALTFQNQQLNIQFNNQSEAQNIPFEKLQKMTFKVYNNITTTNLQERLQPYPNPVTEKLNINIPQTQHSENIAIYIFTIDGKPIYQQKHLSNTISTVQIDVKDWLKGMYILKIQSNKKINTHKIIKQ